MLVIFILNFIISDVITTEINMGPIYTEVKEIRDIEYLGLKKLGDNTLIYYKYYNNNEILYVDANIVTSIYSDKGELINPYDIIYNPGNFLDERLDIIEQDRKTLINPVGIIFIGAGLCHIMKNKYMYNEDIDNLEEYFDHMDKYEKYDKAEGYLLLVGGLGLLRATTSNIHKKNNFSYSLNPFNKVPMLDLSFNF